MMKPGHIIWVQISGRFSNRHWGILCFLPLYLIPD